MGATKADAAVCKGFVEAAGFWGGQVFATDRPEVNNGPPEKPLDIVKRKPYGYAL